MRDDRGSEKAPEQLAFEELNREIASGLQAFLGERGWTRDKVGFGLFLFNQGEGGYLAWISNSERAGMIDALKEWIKVQEQRRIVGQASKN